MGNFDPMPKDGIKLPQITGDPATGIGGSSGAAAIYAGAADPNGTQSATGPSIYLRTNTSPPTVYFKTSVGTSNNEWQ